MIAFTDANYSGSLPTFMIVTKSYILYVRRVLHRPLSEIPVMCNLMHGSVRDFSISTVKNIPQMKTIIGVYYQKNMQNQGYSVEKER